MHTLLFYDPGHFHAALTLRSQNPRTDPAIHVYANEGPDFDAFLALIRSFNERAKAPTRWTANLHTGENALQKLIDDRHGDIAILAGRNRQQTSNDPRLARRGHSRPGRQTLDHHQRPPCRC